MNMTAWDEIIEEGPLVAAPQEATPAETAPRPWPPIMIRDFLRFHGTEAVDVDVTTTLGEVSDFLATSQGAVVAVFDADNRFLGIAVDDDVMALIKRDGFRALEFSIREAVQRDRPVCSITDSPHVILALMQEEGWDRIGVSERGRIIGVVRRRDLYRFVTR